MATDVITASEPIALPFTNVELTGAINQLPAAFGQLGAEGMFPAEPLNTQFFEIDIDNGLVTALPVTGDGPATVARHGTNEGRIFKVPHIEHQDDIKAADIRNMYALSARSRQPETFANLTNTRLLTLRKKFDMTFEYMRMTALKGVILDGKGTEIVNLFTAFGLTKKIVYFDLSNAAADIVGACDLVFQLITQDLVDDTMTTVEARVSRQFFNLLTQHPKVEKFWLQASQALDLANLVRERDGSYRPRRFTFQNISFVEYSAVVPLWGGTNAQIVAATKGHAYPAGTMDSHVTYVAPPEDIRVLDGSAASIGDMIHITQEPMKHGKGVELLGQGDSLPIWRRPKLLVELDSGSGTSTTPLGG